MVAGGVARDRRAKAELNRKALIAGERWKAAAHSYFLLGKGVSVGIPNQSVWPGSLSLPL